MSARRTEVEGDGVLLCAVGAPGSLAEIEPFVRGLRGSRPTPADLLAEMRARYERIGGGSPLGEISRQQAAALERRLSSRGTRVPCRYGAVVGEPSLGAALQELRAQGARNITCLALTPYYSRWGVGRYFREVRRLVRLAPFTGSLRFVTSWHLTPGLLDAYADGIRAARAELARNAGGGDPLVVFTAHSLPTHLLGPREPYVGQLGETRRRVAAQLGLAGWATAYQSVGSSREPWLGPSVESFVGSLVVGDRAGVVIAPVGFISDNLEILYDLDIALRGLAEQRAIPFARAAAPNLHPGLIEAMARTVAASSPSAERGPR